MSNHPEIDARLRSAVQAYKEGPVVVLDEDKGCLHGEDFLDNVITAGITMNAYVVFDIPLDYWNASEWPEILEAARRVYFLHN
jgi:hypothetical protein